MNKRIESTSEQTYRIHDQHRYLKENGSPTETRRVLNVIFVNLINSFLIGEYKKIYSSIMNHLQKEITLYNISLETLNVYQIC